MFNVVEGLKEEGCDGQLSMWRVRHQEISSFRCRSRRAAWSQSRRSAEDREYSVPAAVGVARIRGGEYMWHLFFTAPPSNPFVLIVTGQARRNVSRADWRPYRVVREREPATSRSPRAFWWSAIR